MFEGFENIRFSYAETGYCSKSHRVDSRKCHGIYFKASGESTYQFPDREFTFRSNSLLFIPEGAAYSFQRSSPEPSRFYLLAFLAEGDIPKTPVQIDLPENSDIPRLFYLAMNHYRSDSTADRLQCSVCLFQVLSLLEKLLSTDRVPLDTDNLLTPAVDYLSENIFSKELRISNLHTLCNLSAPTFRKLFESRFGTTPKKYVQKLRMQEAIHILDSKEYDSIEQVAALLGYDDALYFSKSFRRFYGVCPTKYARIKSK